MGMTDAQLLDCIDLLTVALEGLRHGEPDVTVKNIDRTIARLTAEVGKHAN